MTTLPLERTSESRWRGASSTPKDPLLLPADRIPSLESSAMQEARVLDLQQGAGSPESPFVPNRPWSEPPSARPRPRRSPQP